MEAPPSTVLPPRGTRLQRIFRSIWMRLILLSLIFTAGGVAGYSVGSVWTQNRLQEYMRHPPRPDVFMKDLKTSLELSEDQFADVEKIFRRHHEGIEKIREQVSPLYKREFEQMDQELQAVLNETQRELWKQKLAKMRSPWGNGRRGGDRGERGDRGRRGGDQKSDDQKPDESKSDK